MCMIHVITVDWVSWMLLRASQCIICDFRRDIPLRIISFPNQRYAIVMHGIALSLSFCHFERHSKVFSSTKHYFHSPIRGISVVISSPLQRFLPSAAPLKYSFVRPPTTTNPPFPPPLETLLNRAAAIQKLSEVGVGVGGDPDERGPWTLVHFRNLIRNTTTYA